MVGVKGADMELDSLLGGFVAERARRCDIMFPEGDTTTSGFDCEELCLAPFELAVDPVGEAGFASVGVGGVTKVVGASTVLGGVAGILVMIRFGALEGRFGVDWVSELSCSCGGEASSGTESSKTFNAPRLPPNSEPKPAPLPGLAPSVSPPVFGDVDLRLGEKASLSLPTGDVPLLLLEGTSMVLAWRKVDGSSADVAESTRVASEGATESTVSEVIRGEERVK